MQLWKSLLAVTALKLAAAQTVINGYTTYPITTVARAVLVDINDASIIYVFGSTSTNPFYGLAPNGGTDIFVIKMWTNGSFIRVNLYGGAQGEALGSTTANGVVQDPATGDLLIAGTTASSAFTSGSMTKFNGPFLMRVNSVNSSIIWTSINPTATSQTYLSSSRIMIAGAKVIVSFYATGAVLGQPSNSGPMIFKYFTSNGTLDISGSSFASFARAGVDHSNADYDSSTGTFFIAGKTTVSIHGQALLVGSSAFYWASIIASNLTTLTARVLGGTGTLALYDIITDTSNQFVYIGGTINSAIQAGGSIGTVSMEGSSNEGVIAQYNYNGTLNWVRLFGGDGQDAPLRLSIHPVTGDLYGCGLTSSSMYAGYTNVFSNDAIVLNYDKDGTRIGFVMLGTTGSDIGYGLDITPSGKVVIVGNLNGQGGVYVGDSFQNAVATTTDTVTTTTDAITTTTDAVTTTDVATTTSDVTTATSDAMTTTTTDVTSATTNAVTTTTDVITTTMTTDVTTATSDVTTATSDAMTTTTTDVTSATTDVVTTTTTTDAATTTSSDIVTTTSTADVATSTTDPLTTSTYQSSAVTSTTVNAPASTFATATSSANVAVVTVYQAVTATLPAQTVVATQTAVVTSAANGTTTQNAESAATGEKIGLSFAFLFVGLALGGLAMFFLSRSNRFKRLFEASSETAKAGSTQFQYQVQDTGRSNNDLEKNLSVPPRNDDQRSIDVFYMADTN